MVASYMKILCIFIYLYKYINLPILKSSVNFKKFLEGPMKAHKWLLLFQNHFLYLDNQCAAGDVVPSTRKIKMRGSEFKFCLDFLKI